MVNLDNILKSSQWHQSIHEPLGLSSRLSEIMKAQEKFMKNLNGISMTNGHIRNIPDYSKKFEKNTLSVIDLIAKDISFKTKFTIPQTTLDAIASLKRQNEHLFGGIREMSEALKFQSAAIAQINNLNFAFSGISGQIAAIAIQQRNWSIIDDFEEVTEQAIEFSERLTEEITEEQKRQFEILIALLIAFFNKHKQKGVFALVTLEIFLHIHTLYNIFTPQPEFATKEDVRQLNIKQDTLTQYIQIINEQLRQAKEYRLTNRECEVKLKPKSKTLTLCKLPKDFEINVLQVNHKWVFVSYFDPKDNLPQTGWILKKYLDKPE